MKKEKVLSQVMNKSVKNANKKTQSTITETVIETRGRKKGVPIQGIISNNEGIIKALIRSYIIDAKLQNINTCQASLTRYIYEKELFGKLRGGVFKPLDYSTIKTYINSLWKEVEKENTKPKINRRNTYNEFY